MKRPELKKYIVEPRAMVVIETKYQQNGKKLNHMQAVPIGIDVYLDFKQVQLLEGLQFIVKESITQPL